MPKSAQPARFVVETCHGGTDWCIRDAPPETAENECYTHEEAVRACQRLCATPPTSIKAMPPVRPAQWFDFSRVR